MTVPYTFATQTGPIPLSELDANFAALGSATGNGVSMISSGADGTGAVDCATVLATVFAALPDGGMIVFDAGHTFSLSTATLDGKNVTLYAAGAKINCTSNNGALRKLLHGYNLRVFGGLWQATGTGTAIQYVATPNSQIYLELEVSHARFSSTGNWCVSLVGCEHAIFSECEFTSSAASYGGVYCSKANNPYFLQCNFVGASAGTAIFADGQGDPSSGGLVLTDCQILTWDTNLKISAWDDFSIKGCTIDYAVTNNIIISSVEAGKLSNNFLGAPSQGGGHMNNPALTIQSEGPGAYTPLYSTKITVTDNAFVSHADAGNAGDCILLTGYSGDPANTAYYPQEIIIAHNHIQFYTRYGINIKALDRAFILENTFDPNPTLGGRVALSNQGGPTDSTWLIMGNGFPAGTDLSPAATWGANLNFANVFNNVGFLGQTNNSFNGGANSIYCQVGGITTIGGTPPSTGGSYWHWVNQTGPMRLDRYQSGATFRLRRANNFISSPTGVSSSDVLGVVSFDAYNGSNAAYYGVGQVSVSADGVHDATHAPSRMTFGITPNGGGVNGLTGAVDIDNSGNVILDPSNNLAALNPGFIFHSTTPSTAVGIYSGGSAPPTITCGNGSLYLSTTGAIYFRTGGAWTAITVP